MRVNDVEKLALRHAVMLLENRQLQPGHKARIVTALLEASTARAERTEARRARKHSAEMADLRRELIELRAAKGFARYGGEDGERTDTPTPVDPEKERAEFLARIRAKTAGYTGGNNANTH